MWNVIARPVFIRLYVALLLTFGTFFVPVSKALAANSCEDLFKSPLFNPKPYDFYRYYLDDIQNLSTSEVKALNKKFIKDLAEVVPSPNAHRAQSISAHDAQDLINAARNSAVVGAQATSRYANESSETGFCFGRATYLHLTALKMGLQKESIKKIWAVGPMVSSSSSSVIWGYHVATLVYTKEGGWLVIDPNYPMPQSFENWMQHFTEQSTDGRVRFYVTDAERLGLYGGKYSRSVMGLDLPLDQDYFKHYFVDMMAAVRTETLESLKLRRVSAEAGRVPDPEDTISFLKMIKDYLGFF